MESVVLPGIIMEGDVLQVGSVPVVLWMEVSSISVKADWSKGGFDDELT